MKTKIITLVCAAALLASTTPVLAQGESSPTAIAADVLLARPVCFAVTVLGSVIFLVGLPVAATSKSIKPAAEALVLKPARATFTRPLGDFD